MFPDTLCTGGEVGAFLERETDEYEKGVTWKLGPEKKNSLDIVSFVF